MQLNTSRKEKVELLKGLLSGRMTLKDTKPHQVFMWTHLNGFYSLDDNSLLLKESEYKAYCESLDCNAHHIIFEDFSGEIKHLTA